MRTDRFIRRVRRGILIVRFSRLKKSGWNRRDSFSDEAESRRRDREVDLSERLIPSHFHERPRRSTHKGMAIREAEGGVRKDASPYEEEWARAREPESAGEGSLP